MVTDVLESEIGHRSKGALTVVTFGRCRSEMGNRVVDVLVNGQVCPLRLSRGNSGWSLVFRREMLSPSQGCLTVGEQVLSFEMPFREVKIAAIRRVMDKGAFEPDRDVPFFLATMERVLSEPEEGRRCCL